MKVNDICRDNPAAEGAEFCGKPGDPATLQTGGIALRLFFIDDPLIGCPPRKCNNHDGLVQRAPMRWIEVGLFIEVLQFGFEALVDQQKRLERPVNVATAFFDQGVY